MGHLVLSSHLTQRKSKIYALKKIQQLFWDLFGTSDIGTVFSWYLHTYTSFPRFKESVEHKNQGLQSVS